MKPVLYVLAGLAAWTAISVAVSPVIGRMLRRRDDDLVAQILRLPPPPAHLTEACIRRVEAIQRGQR